jgi:hypothetical protein
MKTTKGMATPNPQGAPQKNPDSLKTPVISVRLPTAELRRAFAAKLQADGLQVSSWMAMVVDAYVDGRLHVQQKPEVERPKPSFLVPPPPDASDPDRSD